MVNSKNISIDKTYQDEDKSSYWSSKPLTPASHIHKETCDHEVMEIEIKELLNVGHEHEHEHEHEHVHTPMVKKKAYVSKFKRAPARIFKNVVELTLNDHGKNQDK